jgi:hypothetical protein
MGRAGDAIPFTGEELLQQFADAVIIIDDQQMATGTGTGYRARPAVGADIAHAEATEQRVQALT